MKDIECFHQQVPVPRITGFYLQYICLRRHRKTRLKTEVEAEESKLGETELCVCWTNEHTQLVLLPQFPQVKGFSGTGIYHSFTLQKLFPASVFIVRSR